MKASGLISCIIPTHNRAHTLSRAVDSVLKQDDSDFELIIVDDGSDDETSELLKNYQNNQNLKVVRQENQGVSAARNTGVQHSQGEWLAFLDSDDEWKETKLTQQRECLREKPECRWVHGEEIWVRNGKRVNPKKKHQKSGGDIFERSLKLCLVSPSAVMMERSLFDEMGGFDEEFVVCEDYDLWLKMGLKYPIAFVEEPVLIKYGGHEDQLSSRYKAMDYWRVRSMLNLLESRDLQEQQKQALFEELLRKADILVTGYKKHNRERNCQEVEEMVKRAHKYKLSSEDSL